ncbi:response regulator [Thauera mechernichensis]|uniref:Response regulator n=1 Tax=Thauera mechernichensis TaxID=82788 RepID=A0ABW3WFE9_9RHOO|nr:MULTISPECIES: response regulator [Thauera]ENO92473.1 response regulator receiver protein [Thauera sp. 28]MDG3064626.1 response regulator [Thauera mechernichensis]WBL62852.1 response regulator [Thauera sp. WB-2]HNR61656.1 response regulator [Thauera sp.]HNS93474.1 response regulator [Thauera sp.]
MSTTLAFIVDDSPVNVTIASVLLKRLGWKTEEFSSAIDMLARLESAQPGIILLDISMPDMGGEDACRIIRQRAEFKDTRIVAYTAHALEGDHQRYLEGGFNDILIKPVSLAAIEARIGPPTTRTDS